MNIICFGDSITESGSSPNGWCNLLQIHLDAAQPCVHRVIVSGFSGRHSGELLDRMDQDVLPNLPGLCLIATGINDAYHHFWQRIPRVSLTEYQRNVSEIVRVVRIHGGTPVLIGGHDLIDRGLFKQGNDRPQSENFAPYQAAFLTLATTLSLPLIDIAAAARTEGLPPSSLLADDGVHLNAASHALYARAIGTALPNLLVSTLSSPP